MQSSTISTKTHGSALTKPQPLTLLFSSRSQRAWPSSRPAAAPPARLLLQRLLSLLACICIALASREMA